MHRKNEMTKKKYESIFLIERKKVSIGVDIRLSRTGHTHTHRILELNMVVIYIARAMRF